MEALATKLTYLFISWTNKEYSNEDIEIYDYGFQCFLNSITTDLILLFWGLITHSLLETICWLITFCIYRHHAGGAHASTSIRCIILSSLLGISNYAILRFADYIIPLIMPIYIISLIICILFAPIQSKKYLSPLERKREKIISAAIISLSIIASHFVSNSISISISYSLFIANILIVIATFKDKNRVSNY
ncbi:accessory gene regulator B family protein [Butyrivibrio sp. TB]|uniref:accessory gene regulator B family protein n=1 Tax=Butyrivibrio sp. TB TaxID=1520809 RepID=UPI0008AE4DB1|nr:accessory gene regulator B [Butyrivibrio sp. TB]